MKDERHPNTVVWYTQLAFFFLRLSSSPVFFLEAVVVVLVVAVSFACWIVLLVLPLFINSSCPRFVLASFRASSFFFSVVLSFLFALLLCVRCVLIVTVGRAPRKTGFGDDESCLAVTSPSGRRFRK